MKEKDNVIALKKPAQSTDLLTEVPRNDAWQLLAAAVEAEVSEFLDQSMEKPSISDVPLRLWDHPKITWSMNIKYVAF